MDTAIYLCVVGKDAAQLPRPAALCEALKLWPKAAKPTKTHGRNVERVFVLGSLYKSLLFRSGNIDESA